MIRNEIGLYNRWGRSAFKWRSYRGMHHWILVLKEAGCWHGYGEFKRFEKRLEEIMEQREQLIKESY